MLRSRWPAVSERCLAAALSCLVAAGCARPDLHDGLYRCEAGACPGGWRCVDGFCVDPAVCRPATCEEKGAFCGEVSDGCGATLSCGSCEAPETCGGDMPGRCGSPMQEVASATFQMGCEGDADCQPNEAPRHRVRVSAFRIDLYETTVQRYRACVAAGACTPPTAAGEGCNWDRQGRETHPVDCADWAQARAFCEWDGKRLPTEAEWELAARGTDGRKYPWGPESPTCGRANFDACGQDTKPVGQLAVAAASGAFDMAGNVWEWVSDWYDDGHYGTLPDGAQDPQGPATSPDGSRLQRGGGYPAYPGALRATFRFPTDPSQRARSQGIRCVKPL